MNVDANIDAGTAGMSGVSVAEIIALTALNFGVEPAEITAVNRHKHVALARHVAMYLARTVTGQSFPVLGRCFGGRDHTTVMYGVDSVATLMGSDLKLKTLVAVLLQNIEFREAIARLGGIDALAVSRRIARNPKREAMATSTFEIAALAATVLDLWEVALAGEELVRLVTAPLGEGETWRDRDLAATALTRALLDGVNALRGESAEEPADA